MIRKVLLSSLAVLPLVSLLPGQASAQDRCTAHTISERWLQSQGLSPDLLHHVQHVDHDALRGGGPLVIPVAVHIVWNIAAENVSDGVVQNMIDVMNEDYAALNSDYDNVRSTFLNDRGVPNIQFCLASTDPNGDATTGITRTQTTDTWFDPDNETDDMKSAPDGIASWDPSHYLNIWICDISSGLGGGLITTGYAYLPFGNMVGSDIDGIVIDFDYGLEAGSRTATHEVGHYLGLLHPWADGGCGSDDGMDDTPETDSPTFSCSNTSLMKCGNLVQYENFMDYSNCSCMFTNDQSGQLVGILNTDRFDLLLSDGCNSVNPGGPCIPSSAVGTAENDFVDGVELESISNTNSGSNSGPYYHDYTTQHTTDLQRGSSYSITITSGDYTPDHYAAWIDYDQDDVFESGEKLGEFSNGSAGESDVFNFTVPAGAALGTTIMRVRGVFFNNGEPNPVDPCFAYNYGETEDYGITITNGGSGPCIPTSEFGTTDGDFVDGVELESINNTGSGSVSGPTYHDYTAQSTNLGRGEDYTLEVTSGEYDEDILGAWIDYNANNTFEESELLGEFITSSTYETHAFNFTVPFNATLGTTLLRVRCMFPNDVQPTNADPCIDFAYGETEDYSVVIETSTSVTEAIANTFTCNAENGLLTIRWSAGTQAERFSLFDATGRLTLSDRVTTTSVFSRSVEGLAPGVYTVVLDFNGSSGTERVLIQ